MDYSILSFQTADKSAGQLDPAVVAPKVVRQLLKDAVVMYHANRRVGTVKTKTRAEVQGSSKKLYKQKGTGRARAGNRRTPVRVGGGHAFAKVPKDWSYRLPKKSLRLATRMAIRVKLEAAELLGVDAFVLAEAKTRLVASFLKTVGFDKSSCLLVTATHNPTLVRAARNIPNVKVSTWADLNADVILRSKFVLVESAALAAVS